MPEITMEIREHPGPAIIVNGATLAVGSRLPPGTGVDAVVNDRLLAILAYLAIRRRGGLDRGWVSADDLAFAVDRSHSSFAIRKFLERRLCPYFGTSGNWSEREQALGIEDVPHSHLIQYAPRRVRTAVGRRGSIGGLSRGPYRLGARIGYTFSSRVAWRYVVGTDIETLPSLTVVPPARENCPEDVFKRSRELVAAGELVGARILVASAIEGLLGARGIPRASNQSKARLGMLARLLDELSNIDMELGQTNIAIRAAHCAASLYERLNDPAGHAHALQVLAHSHGQLDEFRQSAAFAKRAWTICDGSRAIRSGVQRAMYIGVLGQYESKTGNYRSAERRLAYAMNSFDEAGLPCWAALWSLRRAENLLAAGQLSQAERHLLRSHELAEADRRTTVPQWAAITRITAHFHAAAGHLNDATAWAHRARQIGLDGQMANQIRLIRPIFDILGIDQEE